MAIPTRLAVTLSLCLLALPVQAERAPQIKALLDVLMIEQTIEIMQQEGEVYGDDLVDQLIPGANPDSWAQTIARIYDRDKMFGLIADSFEAELGDEDLTPILDYYASDEVTQIVMLEVTARRAFLDPDTEAAAAERYAELDGQGVRLLEQVATLMDDSDLVETNVAGALNADFMFYRGLVDGGAFDMTEAEMLTEVWAQEEDLRQSSRDWLQSFLMLAYQPVDPDQLDAYAAFWRMPEGKRLNSAIFAAFDQMYEEISYLLGLAVAQEMTSEKL